MSKATIVATALLVLWCPFSGVYAAVPDITDSPIAEAILQGDYDKLARLVDRGADLNAPVGKTTVLNMLNDPMTDLMIGTGIGTREPSEADRGKLEKLMRVPPADSERMIPLIKWLIAHGANVNQKDAEGDTPLGTALQNGYLKHAEILIQNGADINIPNKRFQSPFYIAMTTDPEFAKILLDKTPDLNIKPRGQNDYIHLAVLSGDLDLVKYFVGHGASLSEENGQFETPCGIAVRQGNQAVLAYLSSLDKTCFASLADNYAFNGTTADFQKLLDTGVDVNVRNSEGETPLGKAIAYSRRKMVRFLLQHGADPNAEDRGFTVLEDAVGHGDMVIVGMLLDNGGDLEKRDSAGRTPIMFANNLDKFKYLALRGAKLDVRDNAGRSVLDHTFDDTINDPDTRRTSQTLCDLVKLGVRLEQRDIDDLTAFADKIHKPEIVDGIRNGCTK